MNFYGGCFPSGWPCPAPLFRAGKWYTRSLQRVWKVEGGHDPSKTVILNQGRFCSSLGLPRCHSGKESTCQCRRFGFKPWVRKIPWRRKWQPTPVFLPGNPMDRGAWRAAVQGVAESETWLSDWQHRHPPGDTWKWRCLEKQMIVASSSQKPWKLLSIPQRPSPHTVDIWGSG